MRDKGSPEPAPRGVDSKYRPEFTEEAYNYCLLGATNEDLAQYFKVTKATIDRWIAEHEDFRGSLHNGREVADAKIGRRLYERAYGYSHEEDKIFMHNGEPVVVPTIKHYPPSEKALVFWLNNRQPDKWREKKDVEISGNLNSASDDDLEARIRGLIEAEQGSED